MRQTKAPVVTPSPRKVKQSKEVDMGKSPSSVFISLAVDMSWKLAISVLLPIIIGSWLSSKYHHSVYLLGGIGLGLILAITVVYQSYNMANQAEYKQKESK